MRNSIILGLGAASLALVSFAAQAHPVAKSAPAAASAERHGAPASYRSPGPGRGYSAQARHIADCLATYHKSYDPQTDKVALRGGATRRCAL